MSLTECLQMALEHNLGLKVSRFGPESAQYNLNISYAAYEPSFRLTAGTGFSSYSGGVDELGRTYSGTSANTDQLSASLGGLLPWGMSYSLSGRLNDYSQSSATSTPRSSYGADVSVAELRQPVLRNAWIDGARLNIELGKENLKVSNLAFEQQLITLAANVEKAYYLMIANTEAIAVRRKGLEAAQASLNEASRRVEVGASAPLDKTKAEAEVASRQAQLTDALGAFDNQQRVLKNLLTDDYGNWYNTVILPTDRLKDVPVVPQREGSLLKALSSRPELLQGQADLRRSAIEVKYYQNQLYPQLDIVGSLGLTGSSVTDPSNPANRAGYSQAFGQVDSSDNPNAAIRAELVIPLGNRAQRNRLRVAKVSREQLVLNQKILEQNVMKEVEDAIGGINTSYSSAQSAREAARFAQEALVAEQKKLENGKSTTYLVLQYQRDALEAELRAIEAVARYNVAIAELARTEAATLDHLNIDVPRR